MAKPDAVSSTWPPCHGAWGGAAVGAVVGILFPALDPRLRRSGRSRGRGGHLWHSMSRADVKEFGDLIDASRPPSSSAAGARSRQPSRWIS